MKTKVINIEGKEIRDLELVQEVFGVEPNDELIYDSVKNWLNNQRQGTAKAKGRSEVAGSGAKPWAQKGTGNARSGSKKSPVWMRGGKAFGPKPRDYYTRLPRQVKSLAIKTALSEKARKSEIKIVEALSLQESKTSEMAGILKACGLNKEKVLLVMDDFNEKIFRAGRNIRGLEITKVDSLNAYTILNCRWLVFTEQAVKKAAEIFSKKKKSVNKQEEN